MPDPRSVGRSFALEYRMESAAVAKDSETFCPACGHAVTLNVAVRHSNSNSSALRCGECGLRWILHHAHESGAGPQIVVTSQFATTDPPTAAAPAAGTSPGHNQAEQPQRNPRLRLLSQRELDVMGHMVAGRPHKLTARILGITVSTVEKHRARLMKKLKAESLADVIRMSLPDTDGGDPMAGSHSDTSPT